MMPVSLKNIFFHTIMKLELIVTDQDSKYFIHLMYNGGLKKANSVIRRIVNKFKNKTTNKTMHIII